MGTYNEFSIQDVLPDLSKKQIVITTNFQVDPTTVDLTTVKFFDYDNAKLESYTLKVDGKNIIITLDHYPSNSKRYYLKVENVQDALKRKLSASYNDYIKFFSEVITKIEILSPISRETFKDRTFDIKLKATEVIENLYYKIELGMDNAFFSTVATIKCNSESFESEEDVEITNYSIKENIVSFTTKLEREGQIYIRARAELNDEVVGDWSETVCFNIYTINMNSLETTFLEDYLTTDELFEDEILLETKIVDKSEIATNDGMFYIEFNKNIKIPDEYELDDNGYINLGTILGSRKELK